jgi:hypothetical protein
MSITREMVETAIECTKNPRLRSVWSDELQKYVCERDPEYSKVAARATQTHPAINPAFKLVFLTAAGGTLLFVVICVFTTILAGKNPPPLLEKTVTSLFDLAKIGFGAVAGLLGGQHLRA